MIKEIEDMEPIEEESRFIWFLVKNRYVVSIWTITIGSMVIIWLLYGIGQGLSDISVMIFPALLVWFLLDKPQERPQKLPFGPLIISILWTLTTATYFNFYQVTGGSLQVGFVLFVTYASLPIFLLGPGDFWSKTGLSRNIRRKKVLGGFFIGGAIILPRAMSVLWNTAGMWDLLLAIEFVSTCVYPGIFEELVCRGLIQDNILKRTGNVYTSISLTAIVFGIYHVSVNFLNKDEILLGFLIAFGIQTGAGLLFGAVRELTDSLIPSMILHTAANMVGLSVITAIPINLFIVGLGPALILGGLYFIGRISRSEPNENAEIVNAIEGIARKE
jgi:membrane protease YdiL (CAAX protease family)